MPIRLGRNQVDQNALMLFSVMVVMILGAIGTVEAQVSQATKQESENSTERNKYSIDFKIDLERLSYTGSERVRWINHGEKSVSVLYFHLYPNLRVSETDSGDTASSGADEPSLDITEVRSVQGDSPLYFFLDDQATTLRINLREPVQPEGSTEIAIKFKGSVPEIDADETSLTTHVVKQLSAALRNERETRRARDINFKCRG